MNALVETAEWAARTSLSALPLALAVLAIGFWRSFPVGWRWILPALFFLRLALPTVPEVSWNPWRSPALSVASVEAVQPAKEPSAAARTNAEPSRNIPKTLGALWLAGVVIVAGRLAFAQLRLRRQIHRLAHAADDTMEAHALWAAARLGLSDAVPLRVVPGFSTLAIFGWWRPVLLLPERLDEQFTPTQIRGMLLHEMAHLQRRDVLWTWLALIVCTLHWFNPLAWLALRRLQADRELACDAAAVRALDDTQRADYGEALLRSIHILAPPAAPALAPFFRHFPELKLRLQNIMHPRLPSTATRLATALLVPSLAAVTFTVARAQPAEEATKKPAEAAPTAREADRPLPDAETPRAPREGDRPAREGARRDGDRPREGARDGDRPRTAPRDGELKREGQRDGDRPREGARDGAAKREGAHDAEPGKAGLRDGDQPRRGTRDGDARDGVRRDGDRPRDGARDGDQPRKGPRDGEVKREGPRDGEARREGAREGATKKRAPRESDTPRPDSEKPAEG